MPCGARLPVGAQVTCVSPSCRPEVLVPRTIAMRRGHISQWRHQSAAGSAPAPQQDLIVARSVRSEFFRDNRKSPSTPARTACGCPCNQPARGAFRGRHREPGWLRFHQGYFQGVDHADGGNINHISHLSIEGDVVFKDMLLNADWHAFSLAFR